jgi:hypothetical protein
MESLMGWILVWCLVANDCHEFPAFVDVWEGDEVVDRAAMDWAHVWGSEEECAKHGEGMVRLMWEEIRKHPPLGVGAAPSYTCQRRGNPTS